MSDFLSASVVIKRDGRPVQFDPTRIRRAVALAFAAHEAPDVENAHRHDPTQVWGAPEERWADIDAIAETVIGRYDEARERGDQPTVEAIGDWTEEAIASAGFWDVARAYVIYRTKHAETRARPQKANGLQEYIAVSKYARWREDLGRRELFEESVDRVRDMHLDRFSERLDQAFDLNGIVAEFGLDPQQEAALRRLTTLGEAIRGSFADVREKRALPSMRALQFGGDAIKATHARQYNCLARETAFVTRNGVRTFEDFADGDKTEVLTHENRWQTATVRSYGMQDLYEVELHRGRSVQRVLATENHRWILADGTETTALAPGMRVMQSADAMDFRYEAAEPDERMWWAYGYVYGDGTVVRDVHGKPSRSMVRLCKKDRGFLERFKELGFAYSFPPSGKGDPIVYTGTYLKELPNPEKAELRLLKAFVAGWLSADGHRDSNAKPGAPFYTGIQVTGQKGIDFVRTVFPMVGAFILREATPPMETTFGPRSDVTISFSLSTRGQGMHASHRSWTVASVTPTDRYETVWCLEVEEDASFVLPNGIVTGNCSFTFINRPRVFGEIMYLLLCGTGVGFSVQRHHVDQLPSLPVRGREDDLVVQHWTIGDTIEGWADAVIALIDSYYKGVKLEFSYSQIRPRGTPLKTSGGRAPGHLPLKRSLQQLERILDGASGRKLKPIEAYDMVMFIARAVLSGGIRRSATIALFSPDDEEMASAKTGDWFSTHPQRAGSNNSAVLVRREASEAEFNNLFQKQIEFGEPGFYFSESTEYGTNPCVPGDTWVRTRQGLRQVRDLIGRPFEAMVDGHAYTTTSPGFVQTGVKPLLALTLADGRVLRLTANHEVRVRDGQSPSGVAWKPAGEIAVGTSIVQHHHGELSWGAVSAELREEARSVMLALATGAPLSSTQQEFAQHWGLGTGAAVLSDTLLKGARSLHEGVLAAWWEARGQQHPQTGHLMLEASSGDAERLQLVLDGLGVRSRRTERAVLITRQDAIRQFFGVLNGRAESGVPDASLRSTRVVAVQALPAEPVFDCTVETVHAFDANGCYVSNCAEIGLAPFIKVQEADIERLEDMGHPPTLRSGDVVYGVQFCNLTTINGGACTSAEDFLRACVTAATIGSIQASYVHIPYLGPITQYLNEREALLGVSITGIMDNPQLLLEPSVLEAGARLCKAVNAAVAQLLGINRAARITCIKPEGTASLLLNTGSGIHPHHAKRYFRRVQVNRLEPPYQHFVFYNPHMAEPSVYNPQTDDVLTFPVEAPADAILRKDLSALQFLRYVKLVQKHWVLAGSNVETFNPGLHHNVSNTVTFTPDEAEEVRAFIWENRHYFTGISLLQAMGDKVYAQAPREEVTTPADIEKWNRLVYHPVDWTLMMEAGDQTSLKDVIACAGGACEISF